MATKKRSAMSRGMMTKADAVSDFRDNYLPMLRVSDRPALRQAWNDYVDGLHRAGYITSKQAETWDQPAFVKSRGPIRSTRPNGSKRKPSTAKRAAPKRRTRRNPEVECREPKSKLDRYRSAKVMHKGEFVQLEGCFTGASYVGRAEGAKKRTTISKKVVRQKASRTPSRVKGVRARKRK